MRALVLVALAACRGGGDTKTASPPPPPPPPVEKPLTLADPEAPIVRSDLGAVEEMEVVGAIPKDSIHRVVKENFTAIRQGYEQLVMANPGRQGKVIATFSVGLDGTVQVASAAGVHPELETCVATQIRKFRFPRPDGVKGDVLVTYPFVFKP